MKKINNYLRFTLLSALISLAAAQPAEQAAGDGKRPVIYTFSIMDQIAPPTWRTTQKALERAIAMNADFVLLHLNTYGGLLDAADSIRTKLLNLDIPVLVFIDNQAASAGALISIACDSIYMRPGGSIGAATVVNQTGEEVPDKFQSFMRSTMRATAASHGRDTVIRGEDTLLVWHRDPRIAEAMVDPSIYIEGIIDTGKVLTLTAEEAIEVGYCEGMAKSKEEVIRMAGIEEYDLYEYRPTGLDKVINFLLNPVISGFLVLMIVGGIYFELQSPGIGFPLAIAIMGALLYFAPAYLEGLAENWEILLFIGGLVLIAVEIFVIPGFGVAGVTGIIAVMAGLSLSLVDNLVFKFDVVRGINELIKAFFIVTVSAFISFLVSLWVGKKLFTARAFSGLALDSIQNSDEGYIGVDVTARSLTGKEGTALTVLRPSGKVEVDGEIYDAKSESGFVDKGDIVKVLRYETGQVYVLKVRSVEEDE